MVQEPITPQLPPVQVPMMLITPQWPLVVLPMMPVTPQFRFNTCLLVVPQGIIVYYSTLTVNMFDNPFNFS